MARTHFSGPVIVGDNKDSPLRNIGYTTLSQSCALDFSVTTPGAPGYSGGSGQFVTSMANASTPTAAQTSIAYPGNVNATIYTPSLYSYPPVPATPPLADSASVVYRGCVFYIPINSKIENIFFDYGYQITSSGTLATSNFMYAYYSNNFANSGSASVYGSSSTAATYVSTSFGRYNMLASASGTQVINSQATSADITQTISPKLLSQVVATIVINGTSGIPAPTAGKVYVTIQYTVSDQFLGSATMYPYASDV